MAMDHTNCDHPRTPAGRAACRKANGSTTRVRSAEPECNSTKAKAIGKADRLDATRILRANADTKDLPHPFRSAVSHAWKLGHTVHTGSPYNPAERVVELRSEHGTVYLTWRLTNPHGVTKVAFRPMDSSKFRLVPSVNEALRMLDGG